MIVYLIKDDAYLYYFSKNLIWNSNSTFIGLIKVKPESKLYYYYTLSEIKNLL